MALESLIFAGGCVMGFAVLTLLPRWVQMGVIGGGAVGAGVLLHQALMFQDGGALLGALMLLGLLLGLDAVLVALRRPVNSPSGQAPGGAHAPGEAGERDGERYAPSLPSGCTTAGRAGRPRSFSEGTR